MTHSSSTLLVAACLLYCSTAQGLGGGRVRRVAGGAPASSSEIFYQASLRNNDYHICGGVIISEKHILTAAHCVADLFDPPYDDLTVATGKASLREGNQHQVFNVSWHEGYQMKGHLNDIAVITLKETIACDENQRPALLPRSPAPSKAKGVISGFGRLKLGTNYPSKSLQKVSAVVLSREDCQKFVNHTIPKGQICGAAPRGAGLLKGDSGGPFVVNDVVVGIASWNLPWDPAAPDGYTDVYAYLNFIQRIVRRNN